MSAMVSYARPPKPVLLRVEITVADFVRATGLTRQTVLRRLKEHDVVLHRRGRGKKRAHVFVTYADVMASRLSCWLEQIEDWSALLARTEAPSAPEDDDG